MQVSAGMGELARARTLLARAFGVYLLGVYGTGLVGGIADLYAALFVRRDYVRYERAGAGPVGFLMAQLADTDLLEWSARYGATVLGLVLGAWLLMRRYRGPRWGEADQ